MKKTKQYICGVELTFVLSKCTIIRV